MRGHRDETHIRTVALPAGHVLKELTVRSELGCVLVVVLVQHKSICSVFELYPVLFC